ncbi:MAG: SNF2-related protein [Gammaproteobacteria bacterium]
MTAAPSQQFTAADVRRWFAPREYKAGQSVLSRVHALEIAADTVSASVQDGPMRPYQVRIRFQPDLAGAWGIDPSCTCPGSACCRHAAATLLAVLRAREQALRVNPLVVSWAESVRQSVEAPARKARVTRARQCLFYVVAWDAGYDGYIVYLLRGPQDAQGRLAGQGEPWHNVERALVEPPRFVNEEDLPILRLLWARRPREFYEPVMPLEDRTGDEALRRMLATGRTYWQDPWTALEPGTPRPGRVAWRVDPQGRQVAVFQSDPPITAAIPTEPMWYVDAAAGCAGPLEFKASASVIRRLHDLPPLAPIDVPVVAQVLADAAPELPLPQTDVTNRLEVIEAPLVPVLIADTLDAAWLPRGWGSGGYTAGAQELDAACVLFRYGPVAMQVDDASEFTFTRDGQTVRVRRDRDAELRAMRTLERLGFKRIPDYLLRAPTDSGPLYGLESEVQWRGFARTVMPALQAAGWTVETTPAFRHLVFEVDAWHGEITETEPGWFEVAMDIEVQGERLALAPLLANLLGRDPRWLDPAQRTRIGDDELLQLITPQGKRVRVSAGRIKPLVRTLVDLFDGRAGDTVRVSRYDAPLLAEVGSDERWHFRGFEAVERMARRLREAQGVAPVAPPAGLALHLRPYQLEGLAWLQYLRANDLAGILADDMGLGKTAQALAHLLLEKESGRLDRPALAILPTSLIHNWRSEAARFAPDLRVLTLHGPERKQDFERIVGHDLVLTTYPLLWRDAAVLARYEYSVLLLDEAQIVKNAASEAAKVVRSFRARNRLCLTGTPLENHLGELWSQFDFLMPGFLGDARSFQRHWRTPIEKHGDRERRDLLARRVRPFILRRRKDEVARDLPPKTIIVRTVELCGGQRDLYETVRSAMDERVRAEIGARGLARSHIVILDALLKLRQVCCDPRLLRAGTAPAVRERAKLELLMQMLPEMVEEGRTILLFSQFTSMLDLIALELVRERIAFVTLTGDTVDRQTPIARFQSGEVPVFLISLRAGGVGLNLTAADTVIHYDPWWNPAVENQATDRAHRIGQDKNVFVYKLIVAGSIEERIMALQERKAELAAGILSQDAAGAVKFGEDDIAALLAPLPPGHKSGR